MRVFITTLVVSILVLGGLGAIALPHDNDNIRHEKMSIVFSKPKIVDQEEFIILIWQDTYVFQMRC